MQLTLTQRVAKVFFSVSKENKFLELSIIGKVCYRRSSSITYISDYAIVSLPDDH